MHSKLMDKNKYKILLVEDDFLIQKVHRKMLELLNCEVDVALNGKIALEKISNKYDLIFMDIRMPDIDGLAVARAIRQMELNNIALKSPVPIIGLTGDGFFLEKECFEAGMNGFLLKPVELETLREVLMKYAP